VDDANSPTSTFLRALSTAADEAVSGSLHLRLVLKGGEIVEGVPETVRSDASNRPGFGAPPPSERGLYVDRVETSVDIAGTKVLLEEVASFTVSLP